MKFDGDLVVVTNKIQMIVVPENPIEIEFIEFIGVGFLGHV